MITLLPVRTTGLNQDRTIRRLALLAAVSAIALGGSAALAQEAPTETPTSAPAAAGAQPDDALAEVVVTAQRRTELASRVPISIATYTQDAMDKQGVRRVEDLARVTPALNFSRTVGVTGNNGNNISIRGVAADVGSSTTAIYIDDTPIQIRNVGYFGGNPYPRVFDLERVEVLRGPQGTLFGAGAEGGAVRFITPQPDFGAPKIYARAEGSSTYSGAGSYEAGLAGGAPIVADKLSVRGSLWYRRDGGYIDQITQTGNVLKEENINSQLTFAAKVAATWRPLPNLAITPGYYYQRIKARSRDSYWEGYGNAADHQLVTGVNNLEPSKDKFSMPSLKVQYDVTDKIAVITNTSYFDRTQDYALSYTNYQSFLRSGSPFGTFANKDPGNSDVALSQRQKNFVQEGRVQSIDNGLIDWTAGVYYARTKQAFSNYTQSGRIPGVLAGGLPQFQGRYSFVELIQANDRQIAGYATVDVKPVDRLKISAGARYTKNTFDFYDVTDGPVVSNTRTVVDATQKESKFTPKVSVSYQATDVNLLYASASQGFRPGGAQPRVNPDFCAPDLKTLGIAQSPSTYDSDSLWNYELGAKNRFMGGKLRVDASVYMIKWKNIQQSIRLPTCGFTFIGNLGSATGKGGEFSVAVTPFTGFQIGADVGYTKMTYDDNIVGGNGLVLKAKDQRFGGPIWSGSVYAEANRPITATIDGYFRATWAFTSENSVPSIVNTFGYDAGLPALQGTDFVTLRIGARMRGADISIFADNLTNSKDLLSRNHDGVGSPLYYNQTFRPRTVGVTLQYRY
jgi:outer membrane receptor protein involved in Fe transport